MGRRHGGNLRDLAQRCGRDQEAILDFSASINPLGPPEGLRPTVSRALEHCVHYPDPGCAELVATIAAKYAISPEQVVVGNGSSELFVAIFRALSPRRVVIPVPSYGEYAQAAKMAGHDVVYLPLSEQDDFALGWNHLEASLDGEDTVVLGQPNNPTGYAFDPAPLLEMAARRPSTTFVVDEAFADFLGEGKSLLTKAQERLLVVRSLTKFYAMPGLRLGFAVASAEMAGAIRWQLPPWSVGTLAQAAGVAVLRDEEFAEASRRQIPLLRDSLSAALRQLSGVHVFPSSANYLLARLDGGKMDAAALADRLLGMGIAIRTFVAEEHVGDRFFRVAVRTAEENARLVDAINDILGGKASGTKKRRKTPALMIQGTSSNAGKSVLVAALGRILFQDGVRVAPFKSQNMSLNSYVTQDGCEMGRAQVVQAQACRLAPDVRMNPILLKPCSDTGSQVIVEGKPVGNMGVHDYVRYKPQAFAAARKCYDSLAADYDAILLEGAGSPGEVNLKSHDIVNMRMAEYAGAPVLIVGDIDRGGVFASFVGTMEVLAPWERRLVAGWLVNRFRGDASLLTPALEYTRQHTGRPVLGVVPYLHQIDLPQEDSVEFKSGALDETGAGAEVDVAVVDLPHISNFTDFDALRGERDVRLRVVRSAAELGQPDAIILPGSKNTLGDLAYLHSSGIAAQIAALAAEDKAEIVGICGGYQMLGVEIGDPHRVESHAAAASGLALLSVRTELAAEKTLCRASATHQPSGHAVSGYEIHHGLTTMDGVTPAFLRGDGMPLGAATGNGRIWGTYLHGVFDADAFRRWFIDRLRVRRGLMPHGTISYRYDIEPALDRLASVVRQNIDMDSIYQLLRL